MQYGSYDMSCFSIACNHQPEKHFHELNMRKMPDSIVTSVLEDLAFV